MSIWDIHIYKQQFYKNTKKDISINFNALNTKPFIDYVNNLSLDALDIPRNILLQDLLKGENKQKYVECDSNGNRLKHLFYKRMEIRAFIEFIHDTLYRNFGGRNDKYCPLSAKIKAKNYVLNNFTGKIKELLFDELDNSFL